MKKNRFALLIFMVLCLTVAAAYATWNYVAGKNINTLSETISVNLAEKSETTADGGTLSATGTLSFTIDDGGAYKAVLVPSGDGFTVTYDATESSTPDITKINMQATVTVSSIDWNGTTVLAAKTQNVIYSDNAVDTWTITADDILACLELANIELKSPSAYDSFSEALEAGTIEITVTIGAVAEGN